jgi:2-keto-4-pentenoate hydratase
LIILLGAFFPNTLAGTIVGNPVTAIAVAAVAFAECGEKFSAGKRVMFFFFHMAIM